MRFLFVTKEVFFILSLGLSIIYISLNFLGCASQPMPAVDVKVWAGDSAKAGISRAQEQLTLACIEPDFDEYACLSYQDIKKLYAAMLQCKEWGPPVANKNQMNVLFKKNSEVINHVLSTK